MLLVIVMHSQEIHVTCTMSRKMVGNSLVIFSSFALVVGISDRSLAFLSGNYDISKMHYDGPGDVPGAPVGGYGYGIRVEGLSSANPPEISVSA
jgi:hypothetical protein